MAQMSDKPDPAGGGNLSARIAESVADREAAYRERTGCLVPWWP